MEFIINYWYIILAVIVMLIVGGVYAVKFAKQPRMEQLVKVREWLLYAVTEAEKMFGSNSGQLKLRYVYNGFVSKFPWLAKIVSFKLFSDLVDDALQEMREMLAESKEAAKYVAGK